MTSEIYLCHKLNPPPLVDDFSGPALSTNFPLGSMIPIIASVEQVTHQVLLLLLDECVAATSMDLQSGAGSALYPIITNKGYTCYIVTNEPLTAFFFLSNFCTSIQVSCG